MIKAISNGLYQPGQTLLHRLDPRLKVLASLLLIALSFSATLWTQFLPLAALLLVAIRLVPSQGATIWRLCWLLRWLLLFTFLMHLLMSPGRTLWGQSWLSYDGLLHGITVVVQMLLAVVVAALLTITTSVESLAGTFGWFVRPLRWLGCRTDEWQKILLLSLNFVPVVHEEVLSSGAATAAESKQSGGQGRWALWMNRINLFLVSLVARGDQIAHSIAAGDESLSSPAELSPLRPMALLDQLCVLLMITMIALNWLMGML